jgi:hypothetical protein
MASNCNWATAFGDPRIRCWTTGFISPTRSAGRWVFSARWRNTGIPPSIIRFDHNGRNKTITRNDGSVHPVNTPFDEPFSFLIGELFKVKNGQLTQIEALVLNVPYGMDPGWK